MPIILGLLGTFGRWLLAGLVAYAPMFIVKIFSVFGIAWATNEYATGPLLSTIQSSLSGVPAFALECLGAMGIDKGITIMLSAYVVAAAARLILKRRAAASP